PSLSIAPGSTAGVTFQTRSPSGQPDPGVALTFTTIAGTGAGALSGVLAQPTSGTTDGSGNLAVQLLAPTVTGRYQLLAVVSDFGVWGQTTVSVDVRAPPPTFWDKYGATVVVPTVAAVAIVLALIAVVVVLRRRRGPRQRLPTMDLRRLREGGGAPGGPFGDAPPPVSRTPPASGSP
ncbi:MAG TPA: hypothetical protein VGP88_03520, partial [Thermoplasmata archaeon]|nr:hypothetical protein [Thermoplasmata archaeon]